MANHAESVKVVSEYLKDKAQNVAREQTRSELLGHADVLDQAREEIVRLLGLTKAVPPDLGDIHDLPQELLDELSVAKTDELEDQIVTVINACGGTASLDQILVGLFRKFKVTQRRRFLQNKLYRMEMVWSVEGKKGVYTTVEPQDTEEVDVEKVAGGVRSHVFDDVDSEIPF